MSSMAKVFIIINFVLSILFLGFAATLLSQKWDYRQMYYEMKNALQQEREKSNIEKSQHKNQVENLRNLLNQRTRELVESKTNETMLAQKNAGLEEWRDSLVKQMELINQKIEQTNLDLKEQKDKNTTLSKINEELTKELQKAREKAKDSSDDLTKKILELDRFKGKMAETENMLKRARKELWEAKQIIRSVEASGMKLRDMVKTLPSIEGQIIAVSTELPIVMLSIGEHDNVQKGYQFTVYRGSNYIGQVVVEEVYSDMSAARIVKTMTKRAMQRGDKVTTKIGGSF